MLLNSALEISENSNRNIWSNGRHLLAENLNCEQILMSRKPAEFNSYFLVKASKLETATEYQKTYMYRHATEYFQLASTVLDSRCIVPALIVSVGLFKKHLTVGLVCISG